MGSVAFCFGGCLREVKKLNLLFITYKQFTTSAHSDRQISGAHRLLLLEHLDRENETSTREQHICSFPCCVVQCRHKHHDRPIHRPSRSISMSTDFIYITCLNDSLSRSYFWTGTSRIHENDSQIDHLQQTPHHPEYSRLQERFFSRRWIIASTTKPIYKCVKRNLKAAPPPRLIIIPWISVKSIRT
jgi:hypothetical protein